MRGGEPPPQTVEVAAGGKSRLDLRLPLPSQPVSRFEKRMETKLNQAISKYGKLAKAKLAGNGEPEDQLRTPFEGLLADLADRKSVV